MTKNLVDIKTRRQYSFSAFPITVDPLLPLVIVLMAWLLSQRYFPELIYLPSESIYWLMGIASALFLTISIFIHEVGHALMAKRMRLPLERIHLFLFGGMAELRRRPVMPRQELAISLAGPVASILFAFASLAAARSLPVGFDEIYLILQYVFYMNLLLGVFNLLPVFPLDGGRALRALLWRKHVLFFKASEQTLKVSVVVIIGLIVATAILLLLKYQTIALWLGLLAAYLLYTAWSGRKELLYEPSVADLVFDFEDIDDLEDVIEDILVFGDDYPARCVFPVAEDAKLQQVVLGKLLRIEEREKWRDAIQVPEIGDYIDLDNPETYMDIDEFSAEFVPAIKHGRVAGLCDAHEMQFWLVQQHQSKQNDA